MKKYLRAFEARDIGDAQVCGDIILAHDGQILNVESHMHTERITRPYRIWTIVTDENGGKINDAIARRPA